MERKIGKTTLRTTVADITALAVDAIVNAANSGLMGGGGVDGAIHRAGGPAILQECRLVISRIGRLATGEAVATTAGRMQAGRVIHTVGPVWSGGRGGEPELLGRCYTNSLAVASENGLRSVAFPSISTGIYGYPVEKAAPLAVKAVKSFVEGHPETFDEIIFCGFDRSTEEHYAKALAELP
jgi:O-acetyl-ADP-ribose deacetylase (regulator of RNase III)